MFVEDIMTASVTTINQEDSLLNMQQIMKNTGLKRIPVVNDEGRIVGIVTDSDVSLASPSDASTLSKYEACYLLDRIKVKDVMTKNVKTIFASSGLADVANVMYKYNINSLPVVDESGNLCGIVTDTDVFRALVDIFGLNQKSTRITLDVTDRVGVIADIGKRFADRDINIISFFSSENKENGIKEYTVTANLEEAGMDIIAELKDAGYMITNITTNKA